VFFVLVVNTSSVLGALAARLAPTTFKCEKHINVAVKL